MNEIKNITLRVEDDFHYSVKMFAAKQNKTLQGYMIDIVEKDLRLNNVYIKSPETIAEMMNDVSEEDLFEALKRIREEKRNKK